jgi:hypothetical protein
MDLLPILVFLIVGSALLAFGYTLFFRVSRGRQGKAAEPAEIEGRAGDPQTCPVCAARLPPGVLVKSAIYPPVNGADRLMHIMGCPFCLEGEAAKRRPRICPVCHQALGDSEFLFARVFERPGKSHVHVLGCINCRRPRKSGG